VTKRAVSQGAAGLCIFVALCAPALVIWWAGTNGSIGDLSELELLTTGLLVAACSAVVAAVLMGQALDIAETDPDVGRLDPWAALFVGTAVLGSVVALVPATTLLLLLPDEGKTIGAKVHWVAAVWVVGAMLSAALSIWAGRTVLRRGNRKRSAPR
jgi:hypothetical protein